MKSNSFRPLPPTAGLRKATLKIPQGWCFQAFARCVILAYPARPAYYVSRGTSIPQRSVENHLSGRVNPSADHLLAYLNDEQIGPGLRRIFLTPFCMQAGAVRQGGWRGVHAEHFSSRLYASSTD